MAEVPAKPITPTSQVSLPPMVSGLPVIMAEPWLQIDPGPEVFLEGPAFDREGNLFISSIFDSRVIRVSPDKETETVFSQDGLLPDGMAFHRDGRLFMACISGKFGWIDPSGGLFHEITVRHQEKPSVGNDLVFDRHGNLYVTDWTGTIANATGGVYRFSADFKTVQPVIEGLVTPNGIALSPDESLLWVAETNRNQLVCLMLLEDGVSLHPFDGTKIPWRFTGSNGGPDSNMVDEEGNLYQCVMAQGRVLIFNPSGLPIANVLIPGRDEGKLLRTANAAFKPGTDEVYLPTSGVGGAWIYTFKGLAKGLTLYSHS